MVNDRQITISVGNNRKSVNWQPQTLMLSEFYEKLRIPSRSTETMQEYLSLRKSEQDDKKDIGGFVAGTLSGPRRKAGAVTGREIITLDFDTIPPARRRARLRLLHLFNSQTLTGKPPAAYSAAPRPHGHGRRIRAAGPVYGRLHRH